MRTARFITSCILTLGSLVLCAILVRPTLELISGFAGQELGPGVVPVMVLVGLAGFMIYIFFTELVVFLRSRGQQALPSESADARFGAPFRKFMMSSGIGLALLCLYVLAWIQVGFLVATVLYCMAMFLLVLDRRDWLPRKLVSACVVFAGFGGFVWATFEYLLQVPLN